MDLVTHYVYLFKCFIALSKNSKSFFEILDTYWETATCEIISCDLIQHLSKNCLTFMGVISLSPSE